MSFIEILDMNKAYYADIILRGNSRIFNKIEEEVNEIFPYMNLKWRKGISFQIYFNWMKGTRRTNYFTIMFDGRHLRPHAYANIACKMKAYILENNAKLLGVL